MSATDEQHAGGTSAPASLTYAVVTPARDDAEGVRRLFGQLASQSVRPVLWVIVDNSLDDSTLAVARELAHDRPWIVVRRSAPSARPSRGGQVVRALTVGFAAVTEPVDVVVKLDADVSVDPTYFERILQTFEADSRVGIASGIRYDQSRDGSWRAERSPRGSVAAPCRSYRWDCLQDVLPLVERTGWDSVDEIRARHCGWRLVVVDEVGFRHHRRLGARDGSRFRAWLNQGRTSHYLGYRPTYLALRALWQMRREPAAIGMTLGWAHERLRGEDRHPDADVLATVASQQRLRVLPRVLADVSGVTRRARRSATGSCELLLVTEPGGHLAELVHVRDAWRRLTRVWVVPSAAPAPTTTSLTGENVVAAHGPTVRSVRVLLRNFLLAWRLIGDVRPRVMIASGAVGVPFVWAGRLRGVRVIWLECAGRVGLSLSYRLAAPLAHRAFVQWPEVAERSRKAEYAGSVFFG